MAEDGRCLLPDANHRFSCWLCTKSIRSSDAKKTFQKHRAHAKCFAKETRQPGFHAALHKEAIAAASAVASFAASALSSSLQVTEDAAVASTHDHDQIRSNKRLKSVHSSTPADSSTTSSCVSIPPVSIFQDKNYTAAAAASSSSSAAVTSSSAVASSPSTSTRVTTPLPCWDGCLISLQQDGEWGEEWLHWPTLFHLLAETILEYTRFKYSSPGRYTRSKDISLDSRQKNLETLVEEWSKKLHHRSSDDCIPYGTDMYLDEQKLHDGVTSAFSMASLYGPRGSHTLEQYLPMTLQFVLRANGTRQFPEYRLFFAPPVDLVAHTPPHIDAAGVQLTLHFVPPCSNKDAYNLVAWWTTNGVGKSSDELCRALNLKDRWGASKGTVSRWQAQPSSQFNHSLLITAAMVDMVEDKEADQTKKEKKKKIPIIRHQEEIIAARSSAQSVCVPAVDDVRSCGVLQNPGGCVHHWQKRMNKPADNNKSDYTTPLIGVQCTSTLLGGDYNSAMTNLQLLWNASEDWRLNSPSHPFPVDLPLYLGLVVRRRCQTTAASNKELRNNHMCALEEFTDRAVTKDLQIHAEIIAANSSVKPRKAAINYIVSSSTETNIP